MIGSHLLLRLLATITAVSAISRKIPVPGAYIFELEDGQDVSAIDNAIGSNGYTRRVYSYELFRGVSVQLEDIENAEARVKEIASAPAVKHAWPVEIYQLPTDELIWSGKPTRNADALDKKATDSVTTYSTHVMTQIDKLRARGITGRGAKIAVIDSGIDYTHPALGGCFGEGCLVSFGTDFVGDDFNGQNVPVPDDDPMDCAGHGTHVAGIISALPNDLGFTGAAPGATLGAYKVFGCVEGTTNELLIAAFNQAYEDGADIITASLGIPSGWTEDPWAVAVSRIVDKGVPCTMSAGNVGQLGLFFPGSAANGKGVTAVASFDNTVWPNLFSISKFTVDGGEAEEFGYAPGIPEFTNNVSLPLWAPNLNPGNPNYGCGAYPDDTPDLRNFIVLIRRGSCPFIQKATNAAAYGARYVVLYSSYSGAETFNATVPGIEGCGMITAEVGERWRALLAAGSEVVLDVVATDDAETELMSSPNTQTGGSVSGFTSWGPTYGVDVKPQFGAPGGSILSTYPVALGEYAVISGTSMACPLVAAAYALMAEVRGTFDPALLEGLMSAYANPQLFHDTIQFYPFLAPIPQQGGGLIQAFDAAYATTLVEPTSFSYNDTANFIEARNFTLRNVGADEDITYEISHVPTIAMYTLAPESIYPAMAPNEPILNAFAALAFSENTVTIPAGESLSIDVLATPPAGLNTDRLPVWSGYIAINGSDGSSLSLPYQGVAGSLYKATVLGSGDAWVARSSDNSLVPAPVPKDEAFTLPHQGSSPSADRIVPRLTVTLALGSAHLRADVVALTGSASDWDTINIFGTESLGQPDGMPFKWLPRTIGIYVDWYGKLDDGRYVPAGRYKIVFRALRITGDTRKEEDWDVAETPAFSIAYEG